MSTSAEPPTWHQALAYAVTGQRHPELGRQAQPDLSALADFLQGRLPADPAERQRPYPVPSDLSAGLGAAQLGAAVARLRTLLDLDRRAEVPVTADRPLSADEQRLLRDVPPHHGS
ncbi:hypothetical protein [uncultured Friedmanniella sp.]|uniref:hypothetical protein n=1 Tax=uncultured Friedmanniella sp. TaxID=335381 RepID=UPI0035CC1D29